VVIDALFAEVAEADEEQQQTDSAASLQSLLTGMGAAAFFHI
jgi:hypothetical protein